MEFREEYDAVYENGVFRPEGPVNLPEKARVRVRADRPDTGSGAKERLLRLVSDIRARGNFSMGDKPFNRADLYERD